MFQKITTLLQNPFKSPSRKNAANWSVTVTNAVALSWLAVPKELMAKNKWLQYWQERPHCCCHLPNNFGSFQILPILRSRPGDASPPKKNCCFPWGGSGPPPNTWFLGPIWVHNPNSILTGSADLAQLIVVSNRQQVGRKNHVLGETRHGPLYISSNRPQLCNPVHVMRPNKLL